MTQADLFKKPLKPFPAPRFNGPEYDPEFDHKRLTGQLERIYTLMKDGKWRTLSEISMETGDAEASISSQLRHMRKPRFGMHEVNKRSRGDRNVGAWEYQLKVKS